MRIPLEDKKAVYLPGVFAGHAMTVRANSNDQLVCRNVLSGREYRHIRLAPDQVWMDVGAHIGAFSRLIHGKVKRVLAYEPDHYNALLFITNLRMAENVTFVEAAVWKKTTTVTLWKNRHGGKDMHSLYHRNGRSPVPVRAVDFAVQLFESKATCVKIDAEGAEWDLFIYLEERHPNLWDQIEQLVFEFHFRPLGAPEPKENYRFLLGLLESKGFAVKALDPGRVKRHWHTVVWAGRE